MARNRTKCRRCGEPTAVVELRRHNTAFCRDCFFHFFTEQVRRTIEKEQMLEATDRVLVAVSGGKDSLALWDVLTDLGYDTTGYHIVLGTGEDYAQESLELSLRFADSRGLKLIVTDLAEEFGFAIPDLPHATGRPTCGACGLTKRHLISRAARDHGFDAIAIGHNLDDEAAVLLGNVLRWDADYLARQHPVLPPTHPAFAKKVKPLYRLSEKETATYAFLKKIEYIVDECPQVAGNTQLRYKQALDMLESASPGTKASFLFGFHDHGRARFEADAPPVLNTCPSCGMPTPLDVCAFCRMVDLYRKKRTGRR